MDSNCCASNFTLDPGTPFAPALSRESSATSPMTASSTIQPSSLQQSPPATPVTTQSSLPDSSDCIQSPQSIVNAAVGAPLGGLFLFVLSVLAFRERRWRRKMAETIISEQNITDNGINYPEDPVQQGPATMQELVPSTQFRELSSNSSLGWRILRLAGIWYDKSLRIDFRIFSHGLKLSDRLSYWVQYVTTNSFESKQKYMLICITFDAN